MNPVNTVPRKSALENYPVESIPTADNGERHLGFMLLRILNIAILIYPLGRLAIFSAVFSIGASVELVTTSPSWRTISTVLVLLGGPAGIIGIVLFLSGKRVIASTLMMIWGIISYATACFGDDANLKRLADNPFEWMILIAPIVIASINLLVNLFVVAERENAWTQSALFAKSKSSNVKSSVPQSELGDFVRSLLGFLLPMGIGILSLITQMFWHSRYWRGSETRGNISAFDSVSMPMLYLFVALFVATTVWALNFAREFQGTTVSTGIKASIAMGILLLLFSGCSAVMGGA